jgi:hypothetical protein
VILRSRREKGAQGRCPKAPLQRAKKEVNAMRTKDTHAEMMVPLLALKEVLLSFVQVSSSLAHQNESHFLAPFFCE